MEKTCNNCVFSEFTRKNEYGETVTLPVGFCKRYPPQYEQRGPTYGDYSSAKVNSADWCGEWKEKEA